MSRPDVHTPAFIPYHTIPSRRHAIESHLIIESRRGHHEKKELRLRDIRNDSIRSRVDTRRSSLRINSPDDLSCWSVLRVYSLGEFDELGARSTRLQRVQDFGTPQPAALSICQLEVWVQQWTQRVQVDVANADVLQVRMPCETADGADDDLLERFDEHPARDAGHIAEEGIARIQWLLATARFDHDIQRLEFRRGCARTPVRNMQAHILPVKESDSKTGATSPSTRHR